MSENGVEETLKERGERYGPFSGHAEASQSLKTVIERHLRSNEQYNTLRRADQMIIKESLDMLAHKIGRVVNGDPTYDDNWRDIAGYALLVEKHFNKGIE